MAADGSIIIETILDDKNAQKELTKLNNRVKTLNNQIYTNQRMKMPLVEQSKQVAANLDTAKAALEKMKAASTGTYTAEQIARQAETVKSLQKQWDGIQSRVESYDRSIRTATEKLNIAKEQAGEIQQHMAAAGVDTEKMANATAKAKKHAQGFATQLKYAMSSMILYGGLFQIFSSLTQWLGKVIKVNDEASAAVARLKGALLTLAQPLLNVIIPAFTAFVNVLARIVSAIASVVSALFGTTVEASAEAAENLYNEANAVEGVGSAAKKASKSLASFDEINQLSGSEASAGGGGGGGASEGIKPIFEDFSTEEYKQKIDELTVYVSGALLALGALLAFSGINIPLGLALMAAGAVGLVSIIAENWGALDGPLQTAITSVLVILGTAALVIGAVLALSGINIPLGLGLMAVGAASLVSAAAINWGAMDAEMKNVITGILEIVSGTLLVLGAVLTFSGANIPLGIGLLIAGAAAFAAAIALNWDSTTISVKQVVTDILFLVGTAFLVIGAVLAFSGANLPLGIGLMLAGAVSLGTVAALNWDTIQSALQGPMGAVVAAVSAALLVLGAVFTFSGVNLPLGIGLMVAGAVGLATTVAVNWEAIQTAMQGPIGVVTAIVSGALLVLGAVLLFTGAGIPLGLGLIAAGAAGLVLAIAPNWDFIQSAISEAWGSFISWWDAGPAKFFTLDYWADLGANMLNGLLDGLKSIWDNVTSWVSDKVGWITGQFTDAKNSAPTTSANSASARMPNAISTKNIPALARGAVIPPNREFLAVLGDQKSGTNIETPLPTMVQAFKRALAESGYAQGRGEAVLEIDGQRFGRLIYKLGQRESIRVGASLVEV